jgi:osmoprotectant transport system permease protein
MGISRGLVIAFLVIVVLATSAAPQDGPVVVASKKFNESYILGEMIAQLLEARGVHVERKFGLGGTLVCYEALKNHEIDVYPEYSGTLEQAILKSDRRLSYGELRSELERRDGLVLLRALGFNNTYAIALKRSRAVELSLVKISDLANVRGLSFAFSHEFLNRKDGWPGLAAAYGLTAKPAGIEHGLAYQAIEEGKIDVTDVYSTDGDVERYDLLLLEDDREYFPTYLAAPIVHDEVSDRVRRAVNELAARIGADEMRAMNAEVLLEDRTFAEVAGAFLLRENLVTSTRVSAEGPWRVLLRRTARHLQLTFVALVAAMLVAIPLGVWVYRMRRVSRGVIYIAGTMQTIPSIALLAFMIPLFGIGAMPAIVALFLYALLPILRNTAAALFSIDPVLKKVGVGMGLTVWQRLRYVEIPLAAPTILAGVKTAAVINIGTATLAAFIGAGGLGEPIVTGLALNDTRLILEGAVPAAILAILTELAFEGVERVVIPKHLLDRAAE